MLGQPVSMLIPQVLGFRLVGSLPAGTTATDLVLTVTERLRKHGVVGKFVEFFGPGLAHLTLADRATLSNMCPEYGATIAIFPIDTMTMDYLRLTGRDEPTVALVEAYARAQGFFADGTTVEAAYNEVIELDLSTVEPSLAGPKRPQDRVSLATAKAKFNAGLPQMLAERKTPVAAPAGGVAVATEMGLAVPVVHDAVRLSVVDIDEQITRLQDRASRQRLRMDDVQGATFTISNLGQAGVLQFAALVNPPQTAILAVGAIQPDPGGEGRGCLLTLSCDHRALDGIDGAEFLRTLQTLLQQPTE